MRWGPLVAWGAVAFAIAGIFMLLSRVDLNAVRPPGHTEEYLRSKFTRVIIRRRSARENIPSPPPDYHTNMSIGAGKDLYAGECVSCHASSGTEVSAVGRGMSPRAVALNSGSVQTYSDRELFSLIEEGVRFTGMPGFAGTEASDQIWSIVDFLRSLP